jgi:hypothetical protein
MPKLVCLQEEGRQMNEAQRLAQLCADETHTACMSIYSGKVALVAIMCLPPPPVCRSLYRKRVAKEFRKSHADCGSILLMILLPIIVNLVTTWILKWISGRNTGAPLAELRAQAFDAM